MYLGIISSCGPEAKWGKITKSPVKNLILTNGCKGLAGPRVDLQNFRSFVDANPYDEKEFKHQSKNNYTIEQLRGVICDFFQ